MMIITMKYTTITLKFFSSNFFLLEGNSTFPQNHQLLFSFYCEPIKFISVSHVTRRNNALVSDESSAHSGN